MASRQFALAISLCTVALFACGDNLKANGDDTAPQCSDGIDNDGDGKIDFPNDPGCTDANDNSEDSIPRPQCNDGIDNDGDGKIDYPDDPGCSAPNQEDETDDCPNGPNCPQCANGVDDDGNGSIDYPDDDGCMSASDNEENTPNPNACGMGMTIKPLPAGLTDTVMFDTSSVSMLPTTCGGGGNAPAIAYELHITKPTVIIASTDDPGTTSDTVIDLRSAMCSTSAAEVACSDDISTGVKTSRVVESVDPGKYYIIVEGYDVSEIGKTYVLHVQLQKGEGVACANTTECGAGLVCRTPLNGTQMVCSKPMCRDGVDDDGDGKNDYPDDPGCTSPDDNDETDTCPGAGCPACGDGIDNDSDGQTDYPNDTSCSSASGQSEACTGEHDPILAIASGTVMDTLVGSHDDHDPTCGGTGGVDRLFTLTIPSLQSLTLDTDGSVVDTVLSLLPTTCTEPSLGCDDDSGSTLHSSLLTRTNLAAGTYIVAVDAYASGTTPGTFNLHVAGTIRPGGSCEPADTLGGAFTCPASNPCEGAAGSQKCRLSQCGDGIDNDGDGKIDFPNEPGCTSPDDDDETDPCPGAGCPECADGIDNDGDGVTDYPADTFCTSASGLSESCDVDGVTTITTAMTSGTTVGATNDYNPTCASTSGSGPDRTYRLTLPQLSAFAINLTTSYDSVHELLNASCAGTALACSDPTALSVGPIAAGTYYLVIDGYSATSSGTYTITLSGTITNGASCEGPLVASGALQCGAGASCTGTVGARTCQAGGCSDGIDNDGDGKIDYPDDPGCDSPTDTDETDACPGVDCPVCANGMDDDADGKTDYAMDTSCWAASGTTESFCTVETDRAVLISSAVTTGTTAGGTNNTATQTCQSNATGNDVALALILPVPVASITIDTNGGSFDSILSVRDSTCTTQIACDDDSGDGTRSLVTLTNLAAGTYAVYLDGYSGASGPYVVNTHGTVADGTACTSALFANHVLACTAPASCVAGTCQQ